MSIAPALSPGEWLRQTRKRLEARRTALTRDAEDRERELAVAVEDRGEDTTVSQHPADVASDLESRELTLTGRLIDTHELSDIEEALERIEHGIYGMCLDCGREIPRERLEVLPQARRDVECERRRARERRGHILRA